MDLEMVFANAVGQIIEAAAIFIAGYCWRALRKKRADDELIKEGLCALLRDRLIHKYERCMDTGWCSVEYREDIQKLYKEYVALGGNGVIPGLIEKIKKLPTQLEEHYE